MKKIFSMLLALVMMCSLFAGCGDSAVIKVGGREFDEDTYLAAVAYADMSLSSQAGTSYAEALDEDFDGKKGIDILREQAEDLLKQMEASRKVAKDSGIKLSDEDKERLEDQKKADAENMGGRKVFVEDLDAQGLNENFYDYMMESSLLYSKFSQSFDISAEDVIAFAEQGGYVRVKHVLIQATEGSADFAAKQTLANEVAAKAKAGEDFDSLIATYGEDPGMESYKHGYIIDQNGYTVDGQSPMMQEFTSASIALAVGGVSAPVQTSHGFHIIKRYPIDIESINADFEAFSNEFSQLAVTEVLNEYLEKTTPEFPKGYDKIDLHEVFGVEETEEAAPAGDAAEGGIEVGTAEPVAPEVTVEPAVPEVTEAPAAE